MSSLSIGKAWDEAKAALQANRKLIVPVALGLVLLPAVISSMFEPQVTAGQQPPAGTWMLVVLAMIIVMIVGELAIVLLINGWKGSVGEALGKAAKRTPILILAALTFTIPIVLLFSLILMVGGAGSGGQVDWANFSGVGWLLLLLCLVAVLYISIRLLPLLAVVASEPLGPIASLRRSFALTGGHFWRLFAFLAMLAIGFLVVALTVGAVVGSLVNLLFDKPEPWSIGALLIALAGGLVQAGFVMVYTAMLARIYVQLTAGQATVPEVERKS